MNTWLYVYIHLPLHNYAHFVCMCTYCICKYTFVLSIFTHMHYSSAFSQPATGPSSVCKGSNVTLQCRVVFNGNPQNAIWYRNGILVRVGNNHIPNHRQIFNSTTGSFTDLVITDVTLEDDNIVYSCNSSDDSITSSVVLNVSGKW